MRRGAAGTAPRRCGRRSSRPRRAAASASQARDQPRVLDDVVPALGRERVGADHEAVGKLHEQRCATPASSLPLGAVVRAEREVAPQVLVLAQHLAHALGAVEARVRPQDARLAAPAEMALDGIGVGVRVQDEPVLASPARSTRRGTGRSASAPIDVELADRGVAVLRAGAPRGNAITGSSRTQVDMSPRVRYGRSDGMMRSGASGDEPLLAVVAGARHQRAPHARLAQDRDGLLRRHARQASWL